MMERVNFFAARRGKDGKALLVVAEEYFGYADQEKRIFVSGYVDAECKRKDGAVPEKEFAY